MKVLIVTPIFPPEERGPATYCFNLCQKIESEVITFTKNPIKVNNIPVFSIPTTGGTIIRQVRLFIKILENSKESGVIYAQGADVVGFTSITAGKLLNKKVVIKFVGDLPAEMERDFHKKVWYLFVVTKITLMLADKIIFPADHLRQSIINKYNLDPKKTAVIFNAV